MQSIRQAKPLDIDKPIGFTEGGVYIFSTCNAYKGYTYSGCTYMTTEENGQESGIEENDIVTEITHKLCW